MRRIHLKVAIDAWDAEVLRSGVVPPARFGDDAIQEVHELVQAMQEKLAAMSIDVAELASVDVDIDVAPGIKLIGAIPMCTQEKDMIAVAIYFRAGSKSTNTDQR